MLVIEREIGARDRRTDHSNRCDKVEVTDLGHLVLDVKGSVDESK